MADPPVEAGAVHAKVIWVELAAVAVKPVGAPGRPVVVALATFEAGPVPAELIADTR